VSKLCNDVSVEECSNKGYTCECLEECKLENCTPDSDGRECCPLYGCDRFPLQP